MKPHRHKLLTAWVKLSNFNITTCSRVSLQVQISYHVGRYGSTEAQRRSSYHDHHWTSDCVHQTPNEGREEELCSEHHTADLQDGEDNGWSLRRKTQTNYYVFLLWKIHCNDMYVKCESSLGNTYTMQ